MIVTGRLALTADRWTPLVVSLTFSKAGADLDLSTAAMKMQVRSSPGAGGAPLIDLAVVSSATAQGLRIYAPVSVNGYLVTQVGLRINETTLEGLPFPPDRAVDLTLYWDLHITPAGGLKQRWLAGTMMVRPGVTQ